MKLLLPNNCNCSKPSVYPSDWKTCTKASIKKKWYIQYYFRDPEFSERWKYGKLIIVKAGVNEFKTLSERRAAIKALLEDEEIRLKQGWNPITNKITSQFDIDYEIDPFTLASVALDKACLRIKGVNSTVNDVRACTKYFQKSLRQLRLDNFYIKDLKRRHVRAALEHLVETRGYSNSRFNRVRSNLMMLFSELMDLETIEVNPVKEIKKLKTIKKMRTILTPDERNRIDVNLKKDTNTYTFWRFLHIFFHSGCRETEMMRIRKQDVDIFNLEFKVLVKKGRFAQEEIRAINQNVKHLWVELLNEGLKDDFIFSKGLTPGPQQIRPDQISRRWKRHVKDKLNITADAYALKHLHTDMVAETVSIEMASAVKWT